MKVTVKSGFVRHCRRTLILGTALFIFNILPASAAEITLPRMEMGSRGWVDNGEFVLSSVISADLALTGGYKYAFLLGFYLEVPDAGNNFSGQTVFGFRIAKATARDIFGLPMELSYFIGSNDNFCNGDDFSTRFGLSPFGTDFRGFLYFPEGIGGNPFYRYNGVHGVQGTGVSLSLTKWDNFVPMFYFYKDIVDIPLFPGLIPNPGAAYEEIGGNLFSGDLRLLFNHNWLRLETFWGMSLNTSKDASMRGGLMAHIAGNGVEFFVQGGIPGWMVGKKFSIDNLFFLMEPRLRLGYFGMYLTFFYHPQTYIHIITPDEKGKANINLKFLFGKIDTGFTGGIETGGELKIDGSEDFIFYISPLAYYISGGLRWDVKFRIKVPEYKTPKEMFDFFIGVRTAF